MSTPTLIPSSRRFTKDDWHPYGHQIAFRQSVKWPSGRVTRHSFRDIGTDRGAAIGNALRNIPTNEELATLHSIA